MCVGDAVLDAMRSHPAEWPERFERAQVCDDAVFDSRKERRGKQPAMEKPTRILRRWIGVSILVGRIGGFA